MALMPLAAAGEHTPGSKESVVSQVDLSYASTLKVLQLIHPSSPVPLSDPGSGC